MKKDLSRSTLRCDRCAAILETSTLSIFVNLTAITFALAFAIHRLRDLVAVGGRVTDGMRFEASLEIVLILAAYLLSMTVIRGFRMKNDLARKSRAA